jgi:inosine-uridine nucleoside N-ribohydrolase
MASRLWIDTDTACGTSDFADPDDCYALALLIRQRRVDIAGVSTVFGNASGALTYKTARDLVAMSEQLPAPSIPVFQGALKAGDANTPASLALQSALKQGPLTIISLGPMTNIAAALDGRRDLEANVSRIVAVMGRRPGHLFHPAEGQGRGMLFGHGPVFRDLNFDLDSDAATSLLSKHLALTLIPYDLGRHVVVSQADLDQIGASGPIGAWIAERSRAWLTFWQRGVGIDGFYPFDLLAGGYVIDPSKFNCARTRAAIGQVATPWTLWLLSAPALLVEPVEAQSGDGQDAIYCPDGAADLKRWLLDRLTAN